MGPMEQPTYVVCGNGEIKVPPLGGRIESVDKPGSVVDDHSSATNVTVRLKRPTRIRRGSRHWIPIWSCSERVYHRHGCYQPRGALLPHLFTLTCKQAVSFLLHFPWVHPQALPGALTRWSPDFPLPAEQRRSPDQLASGVAATCGTASSGVPALVISHW